MIEKESLSRDELLSDELFLEMMDLESDTEIAKLEIKYTRDAKLMGCKTDFEKMLKAAKAEKKKIQKEKNKVVPFQDNLADGMTHFMGEYEELKCGSWICSSSGIYAVVNYNTVAYACSHPILPIKILKNVETGCCKVQLAFFVRNKWIEIITDKETISSASKIVSLSKYGIRVTTENSRSLVKFLSDVESLNEDEIMEQISTSKLGWIKGEFMPYGCNVLVDSEQGFKSVSDSLKEVGSRRKWYDLVKEIRKTGRFEPHISIIASLSSPIVEIVNGLPFILDLYGEAGKGKTVALMLATSVWANPADNAYMADPKGTPAALEMRLDFLNNLPLMLDDMAQLTRKYDGDFSEFVYFLCSGKGKDRSNQNLTVNKLTTWKNTILVNAEHSLVTETMQGGAINRIIDVETSDGYFFESGNDVVTVINENYAFCGREFIELIIELGQEEIINVQKSYYKKITDKANELSVEKEEKQIIPMSILLATDYLATTYLFKDNIFLDFDKCFDVLKSKEQVSENDRAYQFILGEIAVNRSRFIGKDADCPIGEIWGFIQEDSDVVVINGLIFDKMADRGGFSSTSFLSWAAKNKYVICGNDGKPRRSKKIKGTNVKCVFLVINKPNNDGFFDVDDGEKLPFD